MGNDSVCGGYFFRLLAFDLRNDFLDPHQHNVVTLLPLKRNDNNSKLGFIIERPISFFSHSIASANSPQRFFALLKNVFGSLVFLATYRFIVSTIKSLFLCGCWGRCELMMQTPLFRRHKRKYSYLARCNPSQGFFLPPSTDDSHTRQHITANKEHRVNLNFSSPST
jgi:hypothetical protein